MELLDLGEVVVYVRNMDQRFGNEIFGIKGKWFCFKKEKGYKIFWVKGDLLIPRIGLIKYDQHNLIICISLASLCGLAYFTPLAEYET